MDERAHHRQCGRPRIAREIQHLARREVFAGLRAKRGEIGIEATARDAGAERPRRDRRPRTSCRRQATRRPRRGRCDRTARGRAAAPSTTSSAIARRWLIADRKAPITIIRPDAAVAAARQPPIAIRSGALSPPRQQQAGLRASARSPGREGRSSAAPRDTRTTDRTRSRPWRRARDTSSARHGGAVAIARRAPRRRRGTRTRA